MLYCCTIVIANLIHRAVCLFEQVLNRGLSVPEELRATKEPCSRQYLHNRCLLERTHRNEHRDGSLSPSPPKNTVITIDKDEGVDVSTEITIDEMPKPKQRRKSSKDKNIDRILNKDMDEAGKKRHSTAL